MKKFVFPILFGLISASSLIAGNVNDRVVRAAIVLKEIIKTSDKGIPQGLLDRSACVAVIPGMKNGGFIFGGNYGRGLMSCRTNAGDGPWSAPSMFSLQGGSLGLQIGGQSVDMILVITKLSGLKSMLTSKFTLGGDASIAAGPSGRAESAETDAFMTAEIFSYSCTRGLFAGMVLKGGVIRPDKNANQILYGKKIEAGEILFQPAQDVPKDAQIFLDALTQLSPKQLKK